LPPQTYLTQCKRPPDAIKAYEDAIETNPNYDTAYYNMGIAYTELNKFEEAIEAYEKAIDLNSVSIGKYTSPILL
jgi:tetratricopeptide (TPR) repeat protein